TVAGSQADHDERLARASGIRSIQLGSTRVSFVPDGAVQGKPRDWLPDTTDDVWADHPEYLDASGHLVASIGGLLVERGGRAPLIDAGFGPRSLPAEPGSPNGAIYGGALPDSLAEIGRSPDEIEAVAFTHLHDDHVGWAGFSVPGSGKPMFAHAEYLVAEPEWTHRDRLQAGIASAFAPRGRLATDGEGSFPRGGLPV